MKITQKIIAYSCVGVLALSCADSKKYQENLNTESEIIKPEVQNKLDKPIEVIEAVEPKKTPYKNIEYLREKTEIHNQGKLEKVIIETIKKYYLDFYLKAVASSEVDGVTYKELPIVEKKEDSIISLRYNYQENYKGEKLDLWMHHCIIPIKQEINLYESNPILYTDLNSDGTNDLIVVVQSDGGWSGGNGLYNQDIFVFLNKNGIYKLVTVIPDWELLDTTMKGSVRVKNVDNGVLLAEANVFTENDPFNFPSNHYFMQYKFEDLEFVILSSEYIGNDY